MDIDAQLFSMDRQLAAYASSKPSTSDWMAQANRQSARALRELVHEAWVPNRRGVVARFHDGAVSGHMAPAFQILRAAYEFNDAVVAVSNRMLDRPNAIINDSVREKFGLLMRPVMAGSIEIDLVCPLPGIDESMELPAESPGQEVLSDLVSLSSPTEKALQRVLDALRRSTEPRNRAELSDHPDDIGSDGWRKLARLANRCIDADFTIDFWPRTEPTNRFSFAPPHAAVLKTFIKERSLTTTEVVYTGAWLTASSIRTVFDLLTDTNRRISGQVPQELLDVSAGLLNQRVRAVIREEADSESEDQISHRTLVSLEAAPLASPD